MPSVGVRQGACNLPYPARRVEEQDRRSLRASTSLHLVCLQRFPTRLAVPNRYVVSEAGHRSAPAVMAALAGVVHKRQGTAGYDHNRGEDSQ